MTNKQQPQTSTPIIYGLALSTPAHVVDRLTDALIRYRKRIGTRWRAYEARLQAVVTLAWLEGGYTYRSLGAGNGIPKSTCYEMVAEGVKVLARRALPRPRLIRVWPRITGIHQRLQPLQCLTCVNPLGRFAMQTVFPSSDYYQPSAPPRSRRRTTRLPAAACPAGMPWTGTAGWFPRSPRTD